MSLTNQYLFELNNNDIDTNEATDLERKPLDNFQMVDYGLPRTKVVLYKELAYVSSLEELFSDCDIIFLLYQPLDGNIGHWVALSKFGRNIEYFCSYGLPPDTPITRWFRDGQRKYLGELFTKGNNYYIRYNAHPFQKRANDITTCGRWCLLRARTINEGVSLPQFIDMLEALKKKTRRSYDSIVADLVGI